MTVRRKGILALALLIAISLVVLAIHWFSQPSTPPEPQKIPQVAYLFRGDLHGGLGRLAIRFDREGPRSFHQLVISPERIRFQWFSPKGRWTLAESPVPKTTGTLRLQILRRLDRAVVLLANRWLFTVTGLELGSMTAPEIEASDTVRLSSPMFQPIGDIYFTDDFMRENPSGEWCPLSGAWEVSSASFAENSSNPFCLYARGPRSPKKGAAHQWRAGQTYVGVGIQVVPTRPFPKAVRITGNSPAAEAGIRLDDEILAVGGESLASREGEKNGDYLTRVIGMLRGDEEGIVELTVRASDKTTRTLKLQKRQLTWGETEHRVPVKPYRIEDVCLITAGNAFWDQFQFECSVRARVEGAVGLAFHVKDAENLWLLRWWGDSPQARRGRGLEIVRVEDGREDVIASAPDVGSPLPSTYYRLRAEIGADSIVGKIDGKEFIRAKTDRLSFGAVGLYAADTDGVFFDDVVVTNDPRDLARRREHRLPSAIAEDPLMSRWAHPEFPWVPQLTTGIRWHECDFPADVEIRLKELPEQPTLLIIAGDGTFDTRGYILWIEPSSRRVILQRNTERQADAVLPEEDPLPVVFKREGHRLRVRSGETQLLEWEDPRPLKQTKLGVRLIDTSTVEVRPVPILDDTFTTAPADWELAGGDWGMMNRWICDPRWSWFGGLGRTVVAAWHKQNFKGDVTADVYLALMMIRQGRPMERSADIGLTICGDGKSLFSGYTFLVGGDENSWTRLYRDGQRVAGTSEKVFLLPEFSRRRPGGDTLHRQWINLRLRKKGDAIKCYYQNRLALQFEDPAPLTSGRIAVWAVNNGILIGRARIFRNQAADYHIPLRTYSGFDDGTLTNWVDGQISARVDPVEAGTYRVTNILSGGPFAVQLKPGRAEAVRSPILKFKCKFEPGAYVDLYFDAEPETPAPNGSRQAAAPKTHKYMLTGPPDLRAITRAGDVPRVLSLAGKASENLMDGAWHSIEIDLAKAAPGKGAISDMVVGNYCNTGYLLAGLAGNRPGAVYYLKDIEVATAEAAEGTEEAPKKAGDATSSPAP